MTIDYEKLRKHINEFYRYDDDRDDYEYYPTANNFKRRFVRNLATFLFDDINERQYLKKNLPADIYLKVLEALVDGDHDT